MTRQSTFVSFLISCSSAKLQERFCISYFHKIQKMNTSQSTCSQSTSASNNGDNVASPPEEVSTSQFTKVVHMKKKQKKSTSSLVSPSSSSSSSVKEVVPTELNEFKIEDLGNEDEEGEFIYIFK